MLGKARDVWLNGVQGRLKWTATPQIAKTVDVCLRGATVPLDEEQLYPPRQLQLARAPVDVMKYACSPSAPFRSECDF